MRTLIVASLCLAALLSQSAGFFFGRKPVKKYCKNNQFSKILRMRPEKVTYSQFKYCLKNNDPLNDKELAVLIRRFPDALPPDNKIGKYAEKLHRNGLYCSLRALLSNGRCEFITSKLRRRFVNDPEANVINECDPGFSGGGGYGSSIASRRGNYRLRRVGFGSRGYHDTFRTSRDYGVDDPFDGPLSPIINPITSSIAHWDQDRVYQNIDLLARITPLQAAELGHINNACLGITRRHFQVPGVSPDVVASLSIHCFRRIPPTAFAGLTKNMVKRITAWPFVRRSQVRYIRTNVIVDLPFDQLGIGKQRKKFATKHACYGITSSQLAAIKKNWTARRAYRDRCIRSSAVVNAVSIGLGLTSLFLLVLF